MFFIKKLLQSVDGINSEVSNKNIKQLTTNAYFSSTPLRTDQHDLCP